MDTNNETRICTPLNQPLFEIVDPANGITVRGNASQHGQVQRDVDRRCFYDEFDDVLINVETFSTWNSNFPLEIGAFEILACRGAQQYVRRDLWRAELHPGFETRMWCKDTTTTSTVSADSDDSSGEDDSTQSNSFASSSTMDPRDDDEMQEHYSELERGGAASPLEVRKVWFEFQGYGADGVWKDAPTKCWTPPESPEKRKRRTSSQPTMGAYGMGDVDRSVQSSELVYETDYPFVLVFQHVDRALVRLVRIELHWDPYGQCAEDKLPTIEHRAKIQSVAGAAREVLLDITNECNQKRRIVTPKKKQRQLKYTVEYSTEPKPKTKLRTRIMTNAEALRAARTHEARKHMTFSLVPEEPLPQSPPKMRRLTQKTCAASYIRVGAQSPLYVSKMESLARIERQMGQLCL